MLILIKGEFIEINRITVQLIVVSPFKSKRQSANYEREKGIIGNDTRKYR